ncbi:MAG: peptidylprolyl isomerase [Fidelibacterota bacterium]
MSEKIPYMHPDSSVVLATTNEFKIMNTDVMDNVYQGMRGDTSIISNVEPARIKAFIRQVVTLKAQQDILLAEAKKAGLRIPKDSVDAFIEKNLYEPNGGKEAFLEQIELQQIDMDYVREDTRNNLLIMKYVDEIALADVEVNVSEEDIQKYYEENQERYSQETVSARHILFMTQGKSEEEKAKIKDTAETVLMLAKQGEDFAELVKEYSEDPGSQANGGLYEDFPRGRMVQAFEDVSFNMEVGEISNLVETPYGYHIIKKEDHKYGKKLADVRDEIEEAVREQKREAAFPPVLDSLVQAYDFKTSI